MNNVRLSHFCLVFLFGGKLILHVSEEPHNLILPVLEGLDYPKPIQPIVIRVWFWLDLQASKT